MQKIFLYGPPGAGKSSVGKILAHNLNIKFVDIDDEIENAAGLSITDIMARHGEPVFRGMESLAIQQISALDEAVVVALGGGALLRDDNRSTVEAAGQVVFLEVDDARLLARIRLSGEQENAQRPLLAGGDLEQKLRNLLDQRREHYASFELRVVSLARTDPGISKSIEQIAWSIQQVLGLYHVRGMGQSYDVIVRPGGLDELGRMFQERGLTGTALVVCDENVAPLYADRVLNSLGSVGMTVRALVLPPGEQYKTLESVSSLWHGFLDAGLDRKSTVIALGGGVIGDLTGFAAATFMRGCAWVAVPTSLLSMVDASLGGKTGFDLPEGKNLVGAFYPPQLVLADPDVLGTLPDAELRSGLAEVVKHGVISDPELFALCAQGYAIVKSDLARIVRRAMGVKIQVIEQDPFEQGVRASLNLGHTIGHAVEVVSNYRLRHGEAVAIGMVAEAQLAEKMNIARSGLAKDIADVLLDLGLPTRIPPDLPISDIIRRMRFDKKKSNLVVRFALPVDIGKVEPAVPVSDLEMIFANDKE